MLRSYPVEVDDITLIGKNRYRVGKARKTFRVFPSGDIKTEKRGKYSFCCKQKRKDPRFDIAGYINSFYKTTSKGPELLEAYFTELMQAGIVKAYHSSTPCFTVDEGFTGLQVKEHANRWDPILLARMQTYRPDYQIIWNPDSKYLTKFTKRLTEIEGTYYTDYSNAPFFRQDRPIAHNSYIHVNIKTGGQDFEARRAIILRKHGVYVQRIIKRALVISTFLPSGFATKTGYYKNYRNYKSLEQYIEE